jgi:hypothetical protein
LFRNAYAEADLGSASTARSFLQSVCRIRSLARSDNDFRQWSAFTDLSNSPGGYFPTQAAVRTSIVVNELPFFDALNNAIVVRRKSWPEFRQLGELRSFDLAIQMRMVASDNSVCSNKRNSV